MKIQDIFKINLNDRGGVKLFNKIMGRYNIPKADSKELINEVQNSSSGDGGGVEAFQYFKVLSYNEQINKMLASVCKIVEILLEDNGQVVQASSFREYNTGNIEVTDDETGRIAFKILKGNFGLAAPNNYQYLKGNTLEDKLLYLGEINGVPEQVSGILQMLDSAFQEITKEEYESMITYKPE